MARSKCRLSVTVSAELVADVEREVRRGRYSSRSAVVEAALTEWVKEQRTATIRAYYGQLSQIEKAEELHPAFSPHPKKRRDRGGRGFVNPNHWILPPTP